MPVVDSVYNAGLKIFVQFNEKDEIENLNQLCERYTSFQNKDSSVRTVAYLRKRKIIRADFKNCSQEYIQIESLKIEKEKSFNIGDYVIPVILCFGFFYIMMRVERFIKKIGKRFENDKWLPDAVFDSKGTKVSNTTTYLTYRPLDLQFENAYVETLLEKHVPFYEKISTNDQKKFVRRVKHFIRQRVYNVHLAYGTKEMPILIAANAVTISFKMAHYDLAHFTIINVFVDEFTEIGKPNNLKGLVKNKSINFSWKHFVEGQNNTKDGINLGLHELAHAYYADNMLLNKWRNNSFTRHYPEFEKLAHKYISKQKLDLSGMYSEIALENVDEFFAESVELFFEKQNELRVKHREVFLQLGLVLNQQEI
jgi:MtfA peptidase